METPPLRALRHPPFLGHLALVVLASVAFAIAAIVTDAPVDDATFVTLGLFALGLPWSFAGWVAGVDGSVSAAVVVLVLAPWVNLGIHAVIRYVAAVDRREAAASAERWDL